MTRRVWKHHSDICNFNPHHYESGDYDALDEFTELRISIHTTTRVVTSFICKGYTDYFNFNPHHYESGDLAVHKNPDWYLRFQSTPLREWWPIWISQTCRRWNFNPHHYESGDEIESNISKLSAISIHTTTRVVTTIIGGWASLATISIHTTTRVVTIQLLKIHPVQVISIHTTTRVVTAKMHKNLTCKTNICTIINNK